MNCSVALVGRCLPDNENLGLGYLHAALQAGGFRAQRLTLNEVGDVPAVADRILSSSPAIVGLSLPDGGSAIAPLALGEALRARGYRGHVTCGGPFATLARQWLLERYAWIDSVVRYAGEVPLVQLARALQAGGSAADVPGVTTREGDGAPAPVLALPMHLVPRREEMPSILGWGAAHVLATRGCEGRCTYCGPAALQADELHEGRRAGNTLQSLRRAGVGAVRRRDLAGLCDEMASLVRDRATRYFYFVDEHLLPYDESGAIAWIDELDDGLRRRGVGPIGLGAMLRAERLTPRVVERFAQAGLLRLFLGVEFGSDDVALRFGRKSARAHALRILESLRDHDVAVVSNLMIVHPWATEDSVQHDIDLLAAAPAGVFEATRMMAYHGTRLADRLRRDGRLQGNPLRYGYRFDDPVMARFADCHTRLRAEAFWDHSLAYRTHDTWLAARLSRHLRPGCVDARTLQDLENLRREVNALYASSLQSALELARHGCGAWECSPLIASCRHSSLALLRRLELCVEAIQQASGSRVPLFAPLRMAAASAMVFSMLGAAAPACGGSVQPGNEALSPSDAGPDTAAETAAPLDAKPEAKPDVNVTCTPDQLQEERDAVVQAVTQQVPCFTGDLQYNQGSIAAYFSVGWGSPGFGPCLDDAAQARKDAWSAAARAAAESVFAPCLNKQAYEYLHVAGEAGAQSDQMAQAVMKACPNLGYSQIVIAVDANGVVTDVQPQSGAPVPAEVLACVKKALSGLTFPCYAGLTVCPEYAIAE